MGDHTFDGPEVRTICCLRPKLGTPKLNGPGARRVPCGGRVAGFTDVGRLRDFPYFCDYLC